MNEVVSISAGTIRARSLVAGLWQPGQWIPAGAYEILRKPNGIFHALMPAGQGQTHIGTFYFPLEPHPWN